ncbi:MAG: gamma-glutamylcyclotransferase family protein [Cognaticolwellia sp.]
MKYFAYGSNMSLVRLQGRVPSAELVGVFSLKSHQLKFHKSSKDGSGKCDTFETDNEHDTVIGALFEIDPNEKNVLDKAEGLNNGYKEKTVSVYSDAGGKFDAVTYYATKIDSSLKPYSWYLNHVIIGAKEVKVPNEYLTILESTESVEDLNKERDSKQRAMYS